MRLVPDVLFCFQTRFFFPINIYMTSSEESNVRKLLVICMSFNGSFELHVVC